MTITVSNQIVAVLGTAAAATLAGALAGPAIRPALAPGPASAAVPAGHAAGGHAPGGHAAAVTASQQRAAARYWTPARMAAAVPAGSAAGSEAALRNAWLTGNSAGRGLRWTHGGAASRTTGKVFFTLGGTDYVCSGSVVSSPHANVVLTAAHCVGNGGGQWAANWTFVPGYQNGAEPYGVYTARTFFVSPRWAGTAAGSGQQGAGREAGARGAGPGAGEQYDVAFVAVNHATLYGPVPHVAALPAGQPVAFSGHPVLSRTYVFGYPSEPPYSGLYADYCAGAAQASATGGARIRCAMTAGDSGGPWFGGFSPRGGAGPIVAVSSYKLSDDMGVLYGAVLGPAARALYRQACVSPGR